MVSLSDVMQTDALVFIDSSVYLLPLKKVISFLFALLKLSIPNIFKFSLDSNFLFNPM